MERRAYIFMLILLFAALQSQAKVTNWIGSYAANGSDWFVAANWDNGIPGLADDAQIAVSGFTLAHPTLTASTTVKSLTFGPLYTAINFTVNSGVTLTVSNNITIKYGTNANFAINFAGVSTGSIICNGSFLVGDNTAPATPNLLGYFNSAFLLTVNVAMQSFSVAGNLTLNTTSSTGTVLGSTTSNVNNTTVNLNSGSLSVAGNISETNSNYVNTTTTATNKAQLIVNSATNPVTLNFGGSLTIGTGGVVDFYVAGTGSSTINYTGTSAQPVYTALTGLDTSPFTYQNIGFSGNGVKTVQSGVVIIGGNWASDGGNIDAVTNASTISFRGAAQTIADAGSNGGTGVTFANVSFRGSGTKTMSSGKFSVAGTGMLTMAGTATLAVGASSTLTLLSTTTSSATVAAIPTGTAITGNVKVQRMISGSASDLSKRGYRFISSAVYTANVGGKKYYDLRYLLDSAYVSGMSGGGFNTTSTNPSLYLYREDIAISNALYANGNYKGIADINKANAYDIGIQKRLTTTNTSDTTTQIPVGNGVLFFFRGNKSNNATQTGSKVTAPFDYPENVAFTQTGQLNTGTISVRPWYEFDGTANTNNYLSYTNSPSVNNASLRGFMLVGNPYASTINWEKFNRSGVNSSIYGGNATATTTVMTTIWMYNPTTKQYDSYIQAPTVAAAADTVTTVNPTGSLRTGSASNMIASGQGFLIRATAKSQTFTFRESAKTSTQPTGSDLIKVMSTPANVNAISFSSSPQNSFQQPAALSVLSFRLIKDSINTDDAVLAFNNITENTFTPNYDAEDLGGNGAQVSLSIISSDDVTAAIKQVKLPQNNSQVIKLLVDATANGTYKLKLTNIEGLPAMYKVWLKDAFTGDSLDIKNNNTYAFNINKANSATYGRNRFTIVVSRDVASQMRAISLKAEKQAQNAKLTWQTENEGNDYRFIVERSTDNGKTFKELGSITSSGIGTYQFYDIQPVLGSNQYRVSVLHIINTAKKHTMLAKLVYQENLPQAVATSKVSVYPNPAVDMVNIKIDGKDQNKFNIKITNSFGLVVQELTSTQANVQQNVSNLTPGTYLVKVVNTTKNQIEGETKFVKLR